MKHLDAIERMRQSFGAFMLQAKDKRRSLARDFATKLAAIKALFAMDVSDLATHIVKELQQAGSGKYKYKNIQEWPQWFRAVLLGFVFSLALGISATYFWSGLLDELRTSENQLSVYKAQYTRMAYEARLLPQRSDRIRMIDDRFVQMLELIPAELEVVHVLDQINKVARESGMKLQAFRPDPEVMEDSYATLPVHIELNGSFESVGRFLEAVSRLKHLVTMDLLLEVKDPTSGKLQLIAKLKAYRGEIPKGMAAPARAAGGANAAR